MLTQHSSLFLCTVTRERTVLASEQFLEDNTIEHDYIPGQA